MPGKRGAQGGCVPSPIARGLAHFVAVCGLAEAGCPTVGAFAAFLLGCCAMLQYHHSCVGTACVSVWYWATGLPVYLLPGALSPPLSLPSWRPSVLLNSFCIIICWFLQGWVDSCYPEPFPHLGSFQGLRVPRSPEPLPGDLTPRPCEADSLPS